MGRRKRAYIAEKEEVCSDEQKSEEIVSQEDDQQAEEVKAEPSQEKISIKKVPGKYKKFFQ